MTDERIAKLKSTDISKGFVIDKYTEDDLYKEPAAKSVRVLKPTELLKAKYTRRWKGKDGKWNYEYGQPKGKGKFPMDMSRNDLISAFNKMADKHKVKGSKLSDLTDRELFIFIAGKQLDYGHTIEHSLRNAAIHMENRKQAERSFGFKDPEDLMGGV